MSDDYLADIQRLDDINLRHLMQCVEVRSDRAAALSCHEQYGVGPANPELIRIMLAGASDDVERALVAYKAGLEQTKAKLIEHAKRRRRWQR